MIAAKFNLAPNANNLGALFKAARVDRGYSIDELAQYADISPVSDLYKFELGQAEISLDRIYALANVLEISPRVLLAWIS
jgi:transcriptional regulator with XRE-family HTH domain